jgi:hypothetical protein
MAKNYAALYASTNDSYAIEQAIYIKPEASRGQLIAPAGSDFLYTLSGGGLSHSQPFELSPHRSGRHANNIIKKKKECSWSLSTYFNIDETLASPDAAEIDAPVRVLYKSLLGYEDATAGLVYDASIAPNLTFSMFEIGDKWAKQGRGCFVESTSMSFPGDGEAKCEWSGNAAEAIMVGLGKSTTASTGTNVELQAGEGKNFPVGSLVMIIKADGTTRSADTATGARVVTAVSGDVVTLSGAALADADGSANPVYLCYYEPATKSGIDAPVTGLKGSVTIPSIGNQVFRMAKIDIKNNHELFNYGFGTDSLSGPLFVPGSRVSVDVSLEMNMSAKVLKFFNSVQEFTAQACTIVLGDAAKRHLEVVLPKILFKVPAISVPDTGSIPVTFEGTALQTALDAADEVQVKFI